MSHESLILEIAWFYDEKKYFIVFVDCLIRLKTVRKCYFKQLINEKVEVIKLFNA